MRRLTERIHTCIVTGEAKEFLKRTEGKPSAQPMVSECDIELMTMPPEKDLVQTELLSAMDQPDGGMEYRILVVACEEDQLPCWSGFPVEIGG